MPEPLAAGTVDATLLRQLASLRLICFDFDGVFTDNAVYVFEDGREAVRCTRADGLGLSKLRAAGLDIVVVSTETNPVVSARCRKLKLRCIQGCEDKRVVIDRLAAEAGLSLADMAFVGNDINDLCCLEVVGVPMVVEDAHPDVLPYARYRTRARGGHGAVREICELIVAARVRAQQA